MKKKLTIATLFITLATLMLSFFAFGLDKDVKEVKAANEIDSSIFGVQLRSGGSGLNYLVIQDASINANQQSAMSGKNYNAPEYINLYLSEDSDPVPLSSITVPNTNWKINLWQSLGIMIPITDEGYATYNGASVFMVEILAGCTYPNNNLQKVVVKESVKYVNSHYGDTDYKDFSYEWTIAFERSDEKISLSGAQARGDVDSGFYYITLTSSVYVDTEVFEYGNLMTINAYNKIKLYLGENDTDGHYLSEVTSLRSGCQNLWGSGSFHFALTQAEYETYNGTDLYKITVEEGCEVVLNNTVVTISKSYELFNNDYGNPDARYGAFYFLPEFDPITKPISIIDAQVRADVDDNFYFIDVRSDAYFEVPIIEYGNLGDLNTYSHIKIYLSEDDEGTLLKDVTTLRSGYQNLWGSGAMLFALTQAEYETYNGTTIYAIEVLPGCELFVNEYSVTVDHGYKYINGDYGNPDAKYEAFGFTLEISNDLVYLGDTSINALHNRMDRDSEHRWLMFFIGDDLYDLQVDASEWADRLNLLDNISIYFSEDGEPIKLREIYDPAYEGITIRLFGQKNMFSVSIRNDKVNGKYKYCGPMMFKIVIEGGTTIPSYEDGVAGYRVIREKTVLLNDDYGLYGNIPGTDDGGNPRIYEEWNINWSLASCLATFTVVGIDGLTFPDMLLEYGQRVSLDTFAQKGYSLEVTTKNGERVYQYIIGSNRNFDFILTYTRIKQSLNNGVILLIAVAGGGGLLIAAGVAVAIVVYKRKGKKKA